MLEAEELRDNVRRRILKSGDDKLIYIVKQLPEKLGVLKAYFKLYSCPG